MGTALFIPQDEQNRGDINISLYFVSWLSMNHWFTNTNQRLRNIRNRGFHLATLLWRWRRLSYRQESIRNTIYWDSQGVICIDYMEKAVPSNNLTMPSVSFRCQPVENTVRHGNAPAHISVVVRPNWSNLATPCLSIHHVFNNISIHICDLF